MPWLGTITIVGLIALAVLVWVFIRTRSNDLIDEKLKKMGPAAKLSCHGQLLEGINKIPVGIALTNDSIVYENGDMDASLDFDRIDEVEYDDESSTGHNFDAAHRVLRLRSHGHTFEFLLTRADADKVATLLPSRRIGQSSGQSSGQPSAQTV